MPDTSRATWEFHYKPGRYRYEAQQIATIQLTEGDSTPRTIPIETLTRYTLTIIPQGDQLQIAGTVDSFSIKRGSTLPSRDSTLTGQSGFVATITPTGALLSFQGPPGDSCDPKAVTARSAQELLPKVPRQLTTGYRWHDTTTAVRCQGGVPITTSTVSSYRVLGTELVSGTPTVRVQRDHSTTLVAKASYRRQPFEVAGEDRGTTMLYLDAPGGRVLRSSEEATATIQVTAGGSRNVFRQQSRRTITAVP